MFLLLDAQITHKHIHRVSSHLKANIYSIIYVNCVEKSHMYSVTTKFDQHKGHRSICKFLCVSKRTLITKNASLLLVTNLNPEKGSFLIVSRMLFKSSVQCVRFFDNKNGLCVCVCDTMCIKCHLQQ